MNVCLQCVQNLRLQQSLDSLSPLLRSLLAHLLFMLDLMNFDTRYFYKRGAPRALPPTHLTLINYIELHSMAI
jgi:hypothetical protein